MVQRFNSHFTHHRHQVLLRLCVHSLRQAPQVSGSYGDVV